jgi:hypothetical protein
LHQLATRRAIVRAGEKRSSELDRRHPQVPPPAMQEISLPQVLWHRRRTVALIVLGALVLGTAYLILARSKYTISSRLYAEQLPRVVAEGGDSQKLFEGPFLYAQCEILRSTPGARGGVGAARAEEHEDVRQRR